MWKRLVLIIVSDLVKEGDRVAQLVLERVSCSCKV